MSCDYTPAPDCLLPLPSEPALIINLHSFAWYKSDVSCMGEYSITILAVKVLDPLVQTTCVTNLKCND